MNTEVCVGVAVHVLECIELRLTSALTCGKGNTTGAGSRVPLSFIVWR